jgi:cob(I)alamin adenosyltransferase
MSIYTRGGDLGETSLVGGARVSKTHPRIEACGALDEANCAVGAARALTADPLLAAVLAFAQQRLLNCSSRTATPPEARTHATPNVDGADVGALETAADRFEAAAGDLRGFVIPGGSPLAAALHVARATVRRAERSVLKLGAAQDETEQTQDETAQAKDAKAMDADVARFLNRLSDTLFEAARYALTLENIPEEIWEPGSLRPSV